MDRTSLIVATTCILFVAFAMGWFGRWLSTRLSPIGSDRMDEVDRLAQQLHEAEEQRDQALVLLEEREEELLSQIAQTEAELRATMDGLREARQEVEFMQGEIERLSA